MDDMTESYPNNAGEDEDEDEPRKNPKQQNKQRPYRILLVDDEASLRQAVGTYLEQVGGYQVTACESSEAALSVLSKAQMDDSLPDIIISDIRMPDSAMDGLALLRKIRESPTWIQLPVVMLTAKGQTQDRIAGYQAGADAYIPKPFAPEELLSIVESLCDRSQRLQEASSVTVKDLQNQVADIKALLQKGGGGPGVQGYVEAPALFLAPDERRVLELLCDGLPNKEIASRTFTSTRRVQQVLTSLFRKAGVSNRTELIRWAIRTGNIRL
jgi:DNA-binding NarL/FixJ family response regulator